MMNVMWGPNMRPKKSAISGKLPTFTQLRRFLEGLGFTHKIGHDEIGQVVHIYKHEPSGCKFHFADYPADKPVPNFRAFATYDFLKWFDLIDDIPYEQFLDLFAKAKAG
jgi:hypothetical protein